MGLDIYAGTFVRYYAQNWKTVTQQFCEANGMQYSQIHAQPNIPKEEKASPAEIEEAVRAWQEQLVSALQNSGIESAKAWTENNVAPYYTNKPDWDALGALLLFAAGKLLGKKYPLKYKKNTEYHDVLSIMGISVSDFKNWSLFSEVCHYIPMDDSIVFKYPLANGAEVLLATTKCLKYELEKINALSWNAEEETILYWSKTEGYPADGEITKGGKLFQRLKTHDIYDTESLAKFAFSILWQAVSFAEKERVAIIFDY